MSDLFIIEPSLSPRLKWIAEHGILIHHAPHCDEDPWMAIIPMEGHCGSVGEIMAEWCGLYDDCDLIGYGQTEDEALIQCAIKNKITLWNQ